MSTVHSGRPYTQVTAYIENVTSDRYNSKRYPWTYTANGKFYKDFQFLGQELTLSLEVYNLFNLQKPFSVFEGSGNADRDEYNLTEGCLSTDTYKRGESQLYSEWSDFNKDGMLTTAERLQAYLIFQEDMLNFKRNYPNPRTYMIGLEIKF